jgi:hypothetical protein
MTVDDLIAKATLNRTGPVNAADVLLPSGLSDALRFALGHLLDDVDYESDLKSGGAIAARMLATIISGMDELVRQSSTYSVDNYDQ